LGSGPNVCKKLFSGCLAAVLLLAALPIESGPLRAEAKELTKTDTIPPCTARTFFVKYRAIP